MQTARRATPETECRKNSIFDRERDKFPAFELKLPAARSLRAEDIRVSARYRCPSRAPDIRGY